MYSGQYGFNFDHPRDSIRYQAVVEIKAYSPKKFGIKKMKGISIKWDYLWVLRWRYVSAYENA